MPAKCFKIRFVLAAQICVCFQLFSQSNYGWAQRDFKVTPAYREATSTAMLAEVNEYAQRLNLPEVLPITTNALKELFITPPYMAIRFGALGNIRTTNYSYGFGKGRHLCYITRLIKGQNPYSYDENKQFAIDPSVVNTNAAYIMATQFLAKAFVNVEQLNKSSTALIEPWVIRDMTTSKYTVEWQCNGQSVVKVTLVQPESRALDVASRRCPIDFTATDQDRNV